MLAVSAVRGLPDGARWLGASAMVGATRTGQILAASLLDYYRTTLHDVREVGYTRYAVRQLSPYVRAAASHLAPTRRTMTERFLERK
jgi:hypothetical protein